MPHALGGLVDGQLAAEQRQRQKSVSAEILVGDVGRVDLVEGLLQLVDLAHHVAAAQGDPRKHDVGARAIVGIRGTQLNFGGILGFAVLVLHPRDRSLVIVALVVERIAGEQLAQRSFDQPAPGEIVARVAKGGAQQHVAGHAIFIAGISKL